MKKLVIVLAALVGTAALFLGALAYTAGGLSSDNLIRAMLNFRFGNFGGGFRSGGVEPFDAKAIKFGIRWYPTYVSFGPDNDTLLVSLCHVQRNGLCRIAKYSLSKDRWDIYAYDERRAYDRPLFSPDGQWIYYAASDLCNTNYDECGDPKVYRMRPDGTGVEVFADLTIVHPTFSLDGKRLIYWGLPVPKALLANEVHMLDIATRQETQLTGMTSMMSQPSNPPFLTADGEHFIYAADLSEWQGTTSCAVDPATIPTDPKTGKKDFGPLFGDKENTGVYLAAIKDAPITKENCYKLTPIWSKSSGHAGGYPCAMDGQGRFLYQGDLGYKKQQGDPVALALRPVGPNDKPPIPLTIEEEQRKYPFATLTDEQLRRGDGARLSLKRDLEDSPLHPGTGRAVFLSRLDPGSDEAAFDIGGCEGGSLSRDGNQLAFLWGGISPGNSNAVFVLKYGAPLKQVRLILNWPKLDLVPTLPAKP